MSGKRNSEEFKIEAVKQITERNYPIGQVSKRLGVTTKNFYAWIKRYSDGPSQHSQITDQQREIRDLKAHRSQHAIRLLCQAAHVHRSGYYAWLQQPQSLRTKEDKRLLGLIKRSWMASGCVYGYRKAHHDLRESGESCSKSRVERLMKHYKLKTQVGYKKRRYMNSGEPATVAPNILKRQFDVGQPNQSWVTDITYIRTYEGWLYLAVVLDLFSRQIIGWSMQSRMEVDLVMRALIMAMWKRKPDNEVVVHSDQGSQYTSSEWQDFLEANNLKSSMSRRGNCHESSVKIKNNVAG